MEERGTWWREAKFGMFIHWGLYALLAGSYGGAKAAATPSGSCTICTYRRRNTGPSPGASTRWTLTRTPSSASARGGMRYIVFTAKHHDGFAMYHSRASRYNIVDATPFGRDVATLR